MTKKKTFISTLPLAHAYIVICLNYFNFFPSSCYIVRKQILEGKIKVNPISLQAGGVLIKDQTILLAKIEYGANSGKWMLPGGFLEHGESIEEAACREFLEETGIVTTTNRIVGMRSGTREVDGFVQTTMYIVFEMNFESGELEKDEIEISDLKYWTIQEIEKSNEIIELSKEIALKTFYTRNGLYKGKELQVNNSYKSYEYYLPNE